MELEDDRLSQTDGLEDEFSKASQYVAARLASKASSADLLYLYARYKQATEGPCSSDRPTGWFDAKGKQKWDSWNGMGDMSKPQAMLEYISMVESLDPDFEAVKNSDAPIKGSQFGMSVSILRKDENPLTDDSKTIFDWTKEGNITEVERFLTSAEELPEDEGKLTPLHWACDRGHLEVIERILEKFPKEVNRKDINGLTPLHYACCCEYPDVIRLLLEYGADPNLEDGDGNDCRADVTRLSETS